MAGFFVVMMWLFFLGVILFGGIYLLYAYILESIFLMNVCRSLDMGAPWQGWIPFYSQYLFGKAAGKSRVGILVALAHLAAVALAVWFLRDPLQVNWYGTLLAVVTGIVGKMLLAARIFKTWAGERGKLYTVLSVVSLGILRPTFLFLIRKKVCMLSKNT